MKSGALQKGTPVEFCVRRGEHNMLAGRPGVIEGRKGRKYIVRCIEVGTMFSGGLYETTRENIRKAKKCAS